jgi:hypothetical protein
MGQKDGMELPKLWRKDPAAFVIGIRVTAHQAQLKVSLVQIAGLAPPQSAAFRAHLVGITTYYHIPQIELTMNLYIRYGTRQRSRLARSS